jgi:hypothetical protein
MPDTTAPGAETLHPAQAVQLCQLVEVEARWENLRRTPSPDPTVRATTADLQRRQKAYELFHAKLTAYNKAYRPGHVAELLLNNPSRLGLWCRRMRDLCRTAGCDPQCPCPASLVEKAYGWADRISLRQNAPRVSRPLPPTTMAATIRELESLSRWCEALAGADGQPAPVPLAPA